MEDKAKNVCVCIRTHTYVCVCVSEREKQRTKKQKRGEKRGKNWKSQSSQHVQGKKIGENEGQEAFNKIVQAEDIY